MQQNYIMIVSRRPKNAESTRYFSNVDHKIRNLGSCLDWDTQPGWKASHRSVTELTEHRTLMPRGRSMHLRNTPATLINAIDKTAQPEG